MVAQQVVQSVPVHAEYLYRKFSGPPTNRPVRSPHIGRICVVVVVVVVVVSYIVRIGCEAEKLLYTVANRACDLLNSG